MSKPTIVFSHGAWHPPSFFNKVIAVLEPLGYKCVTFSFPGTGRVPAVKSLDEDVAAVRAVVLKEVDAGADVMLSAHSWGGVPMCTALDGLSKAERQRDGKPGGVVKLTFVAAFVLPEETSLADILGGRPDFWVPDADGNLKNPEDKDFFYHDLPSDEADEWLAKLKPHSLATLLDKTKSAAWKTIPSSYLICEDDHIMSIALQESMIATVKEQGGEIETERLFVSHSAHLALPEKVAGFLRRAAGEDWKEDL